MRHPIAAIVLVAMLSCAVQRPGGRDAPAEVCGGSPDVPPANDGSAAMVTCPSGPQPACDDGNANSGDGCSSGVVEPGYACLKSGALSVCVPCSP